jgi:MFS family permease
MLLNYVRTLRNLNRNVLLYLAATSLLGFSFDGGVFSVLFNLYLLRLGFGPEFIGQVASAGLLSFSLASLPAGSIGERFGYRVVMVVGLLMIVGGGVLLPLAELLPPFLVAPSILALYIIMFAGLGLYFVNAVPYVMSLSTDDERNRAFSMQTALLALAAFTGSLAGGFLPRLVALILGIDQHQAAAYRYPLIIATVLLLPSIWILSRIRRPTTEILSEPLPYLSENAPIAAPTPVVSSRWGLYSPVIITLIMLSIVRFFQVSGVATVYTFFNVYMDTELAVPTSQIGLIAALARLIGVFAALSTPILVTRWGAPRTVLVASLIGTFSILPLALVPVWTAAGIGFIGVTAISSMRFPAFMIFSTSLVPPNWRGTLAGLGEFSGGLSFAGLAFIGGSMAEKQGFSSLFLLGGAMTLAGTFLFYIWYVLPRSKHLPTPVAEVSSEPLL